MSCYCKKCKYSREKWRLANRDRINQKRRENRARKKVEKSKNKKCLLCEIRMENNNKGTIVYCRDCVNRFPIKVRRHRWRRYRLRKKRGVV